TAKVYKERFWTIGRLYWLSGERFEALFLLAILLGLLGLTTWISVELQFYVGRYTDALKQSDVSAFHYALGLWALLVITNVVVTALSTWRQEHLGLEWRKGLTQHYVELYHRYRSYYLIDNSKVDNVDERLGQDIPAFAKGTIKFGVIIFSSVVNFVSFITILWHFSGWLVVTAIVYA